MSFDPDKLQPSDVGAVAWTHPPFLCSGYFNPGTSSVGRLMTFAFRTPVHATVTKIYHCGLGGAGLSNCFLGIYASSQNGGSLLAGSADMSASWVTSNAYAATLSKAVDLIPGVPYRVGVLMGAATTAWQFWAASSTATSGYQNNLGAPDGSKYASAIGPAGSLTALPAY